jgi:hypothetical protein
MDGDGKTDVVGLFAGLSVLFGTGSESLLSGPSEFPLPADAFDMEVADLNGDGKLDVVVAHPLGLISIFLNGRVTLDSLSAAVNALGLAGGQANSLQAKLRAATASQARGDTRTAANQLNAFINEVNAMKRSRRLSAAQFNALITLAQQVIAGL